VTFSASLAPAVSSARARSTLSTSYTSLKPAIGMLTGRATAGTLAVADIVVTS